MYDITNNTNNNIKNNDSIRIKQRLGYTTQYANDYRLIQLSTYNPLTSHSFNNIQFTTISTKNREKRRNLLINKPLHIYFKYT